MGSHKTADEVKKQHVEKMGDDLGSLFHALWNEVAWLYSKWDEYVELFGTKPSRIELLNKSAPLFFRTVQDSLWADTLLHIARLTDPPKSAGKSNLTIQRLSGLVDKKVETNVSNLTKIAIEKTAFCRDWRNRRIAHRDLKLAMGEGAKPLEPASRAMVKDALKGIAAVLNAISEYYLDSTIMFDVIKGSFGAVSLLYVLDDGLQAESERRNRIKSGEYRQDDLKARDL
jgi:hypothetical protein